MSKDQEHPSFTYNGEIAGAYAGLGYVEPGKVVTPTTDFELSVIKNAPKGLFTEFTGKVSARNRASLPADLYGLPPVEVTEVELPNRDLAAQAGVTTTSEEEKK